jgi:hypothetical protein
LSQTAAPSHQYVRDTLGQGDWAQRESFVGLLEWLAQLSNLGAWKSGRPICGPRAS